MASLNAFESKMNSAGLAMQQRCKGAKSERKSGHMKFT